MEIKIKPNENGHFRGINIAVINPKNGKTLVAQAFDTHETSVEFDYFV